MAKSGWVVARFLPLVLLGALLAAPVAGYAQSASGRQALEEEARKAADAASRRKRPGDVDVKRDEANVIPPKDERAFLYDYGGWGRSSFTTFDDVGRDRTIRENDVRFYGSTKVLTAHELYVRGQMTWVNFNKGDSFNNNQFDLVGPRLDQGYYAVDAAHYVDDERLDADVSVGRQFLNIGSGVAYNAVADGGKVEGKWRVDPEYTVDFKVLGSRTVHSANDIDGSKPGSNRSRRFFYGGEVGLERFGWGFGPEVPVFVNFRPHLYFLTQRDAGRESPQNATREFEYDSWYVGFGGLTELSPKTFGEWVKNFSFNGEIVGEFGKSFGATAGAPQDRVEAYAFTAETEYFFDVMGKPRVTLAYLLASGDKNRGSVTGTVGGNRSGSHDRGFLGFGYVLTGFVLNPRFSNLHVVRSGVSWQPIEKREYVENFEVGAQYYLFAKAARAGAVSDFRAFKTKRFVGTELDLFTNWAIFSDLTASLKFGNYSPGSAYANRQDRLFLTASLTLSF
ncbi:MAG: alginate export family protein [Planctomycetes bacterium]|nr:alginate export family protein [Planctomycetota bacterium]